VAEYAGWYLPTKPRYLPRWVLACRNGWIYYSRGGVKHYECRVSSMKAWITRAAARPADKSKEL
jgi:hypothetical protein